MNNRRREWLWFFVFAFVPAAARAEHAVIDLLVVGPDGQAESFVDQDPPLGGVNPHGKMTVKAGDPLVLQFILTNAYPHGLVKDVSIRYFVMHTDKLGMKEVPDLKEHEQDVITQGEVTMNFKPKCRVGARLKFRVEQPGIYLVRLETLNTKSDHEHFSAIDLVVK